MEPVPPPHERQWRHPSELAPPPLEETSRKVRIGAAMTGAASVALVGLFALTVTPTDSTVVISTSTLTPSALAPGGTAYDGASLVSTTHSWSDEETPFGTVVVLVDASATVTAAPSSSHDGLAPKATVRFSPRVTTTGFLVAEIGGVAIVELDQSRGARRPAPEKFGINEYVVASSVPDRRDEVTALAGDLSHRVALDDLPALGLQPGTVVLDENGHLVAVCDENGHATMVAPEPRPDPVTPTTAATSPPRPTSPTTTVAPTRPSTTPSTTTLPDTSTAPSTTDATTTTSPPSQTPAPTTTNATTTTRPRPSTTSSSTTTTTTTTTTIAATAASDEEE